MVADTRAANGPRRTEVKPQQAAPLRPLNKPRPIVVQTDECGVPLTIVISKVKRAVESAQETWRIDDEWWRVHPISRRYWRALLEDGRTVDVFHDLTSDRWYKQAYTT